MSMGLVPVAIFMLKLVPGRLYAGVKAWYIKLNIVKLKLEKCVLYYSSITENSQFVDAVLQ